MTEPKHIELYFAEAQPPILCGSLCELDMQLDRLHEECDPASPICAEIRVGGFAIDVGLGIDPTFICIQVEPFDGEYYQSVGDPAAEGCVDFYGCGNHTPIDLRTLVPASAIRDAVRLFIANRTLLGSFKWEDWAGETAPRRL